MTERLSVFYSFIEPYIFTPYFKVGFALFSVFFILLMIGIMRKYYFHLRMEGANFGFAAGMIFVIVIEVIIASGVIYGKEAVHIITGKKDPSELAEITKTRLGEINQVLGIQTCTATYSSYGTFAGIIEELSYLSASDESKLRRILCK